jgi:hypothetical protein
MTQLGKSEMALDPPGYGVIAAVNTAINFSEHSILAKSARGVVQFNLKQNLIFPFDEALSSFARKSHFSFPQSA